MKRWVDGPGLVAWLEETVPESLAQLKARANSFRGKTATREELNLLRRLNDWEHGATADIYNLDRYLILLGTHITFLPDGLFTTRDPRDRASKANLTKQARAKLQEGIRAGTPPLELARTYGISTRTVRFWKKRVEAE